MNWKKCLRLGLVLGFASLAAGCILFSSAKDKATRNTPSFKDGYGDGCAAATAQSSNYREGPYRDEQLYKTDSLYRAGWANGYQTCNPNRSGAVPGANPMPTPLPGH
jgi:hypothetical protein